MQKNDLLPILKEAKKYAVKRKKRDEWDNTPIPILTSVKFISKNGKLTIETTDLEKYFTCTVDTDIPDMEIVIDIKFLHDLINVLEKENICFKTLDNFEFSQREKNNPYSSFDHSYSVTTFNKPVLVIKQNRTEFNAIINSSGTPDEFPSNPMRNNLLHTPEDIFVGKNKIPAKIYYYPQDDWTIQENSRKEKKKAINKLFPKYLKIDGLVAKKGRLQESYKYNNGNPTYKYYCDYQISHDGDNFEQRVFVDEIENYEAIDMSRKRRK